jgi:hypothetical protein
MVSRFTPVAAASRPIVRSRDVDIDKYLDSVVATGLILPAS